MNKSLQKSILKLLLCIIAFITMLLINNNSYARSYSIKDMNIQATVLDDGSVNVKQSITYNFKGSYNGIYITIPYNLSDYEMDEVNGEISNNAIYNGSSVTLNKVTDSKGTIYKETSYATNGDKGKYTISKDSEKYTIKVYSPSQDTTKTFILDYNISNICVSYADVGELYYNFVGGKWDVEIEKLNIDIFLPNNETENDLYAFGHGTYNGVVTIVSKNQVNLKVSNVKKGQYVAARVVFNKDNIKNSTKIMGANALSKIMQQEKNIYENKENKQKFTNKLLVLAIILFAYWIILLFIYERDKKYVAACAGEQELFEKYNPLIAGCIQGSREILARDIIAVILNLIDKKVIEIEIKQNLKEGEPYKYFIKKTENAYEKMDEIEKYVYDWIFGKNGVLNLADRLKEIPKQKDANKRFKELNEMAKSKLNKVGANISKVPVALRIFNVVLFLLSIILVFMHFQYNKLEIYDFNSIYLNIGIVVQLLLIFLPIFMGIIYILMNFLVATRHRVHKLIRKFTGQKIATTTASIVLIFLVIILITAIFTKTSRFLIVDELLLGISLLIMLTDNLMLKNNANMIEDFSRLNMIKDKLEDDKLFEERDVEQVVLWGKYLAYGVAFGVAGKISKKIKEMHIDDDLEYLLESTSMLEYMNSGYYDFYLYASLDRRFVRNYNKATKKMFSGMGSRRWILITEEVGGFSRWRWPVDFHGGGGFSGGGGRGRWTVEHSKIRSRYI